MIQTKSPPSSVPPQEHVPLRDPFVAVILAWLIPGLGHWYQGRRAKAVIFFVCIMSSFYYGLYLGEGRVVYASWNSSDRRLPLLCQAFVGIPTVPAFVQARRFGFYNDEYSLRNRTMLAYKSRLGITLRDNEVPSDHSPELTRSLDRLARNEGSFWSWFMVPPVVKQGDGGDTPDELDLLHKNLNRYFELGTVYTMIAGLLNVLVIYDAWGGPAFSVRSPKFMAKLPAETSATA
ncbi:MAG: hypothetical protein JNM18_21375 [Planctomycetaceae bacterium]|nr:hypothetical protein [Planctomycetaceae bacterium]